MNFPKNELRAYRLRMALGLPTYTTRVSSERGKYFVGQIVDSPLGKLRIEEVRAYNSWDKHPFHNELTSAQKAQILGAFEVIRFSSYEKQ